MIDTSAPTAAPADDLFATKNPGLVAGQRFAWSDKAKPLTGAHARLRIGLFAYIAVAVFNIIVIGSMMYMFSALQDPSQAEAPSEAVIMIANIVGFGGIYLPFALIGVTVVCIILYLLFVYRATKNLQVSNARGISVSPGWAVGWSFIPLANLGMIPSIMRQIWTASTDPSRGAASPPVITIVWWATWLGGGAIGRVSDGLTPKDAEAASFSAAELSEAFTPAFITSLLSSGLAIVSTFCLMVIIKQIRDSQEALRTTSAFDE
jgi:hypothetical protein